MTVKKGDKIKVDYEGRFESGEVFDSSKHGDHSHPLEFEVGSGQVIKGFDDAVLGMKKGEEKEFKIPAKEAYGEHRKELEQRITKDQLVLDKKPEVGMILGLNTPDGRQAAVPVVAVDDDSITLDLNHPLAGKNLIFKIKLVSIN